MKTLHNNNYYLLFYSVLNPMLIKYFILSYCMRLSSCPKLSSYKPRSNSIPVPPSRTETLTNKDHYSKNQDEGGQKDQRALIQVSGTESEKKEYDNLCL